MTETQRKIIIRPAIREMTDDDLQETLRLMMDEGDCDDADALFTRELCFETAYRKKLNGK